MYVPRYLLFVPYSRELEQAPFFASCVCFSSPLLHEKRDVDERLFRRNRKRRRKIYDIPTHPPIQLLSFLQTGA